MYKSQTQFSFNSNRIAQPFKLIAIFTIAILMGPWSAFESANAQDTDFRAPQQVDGTTKGSGAPQVQLPNESNPQSPSIQPGQLKTQQAFDQLVKELSNLIPGDSPTGSPQRKAIEDAVTAFQLRDAKRVIEIFKTQAAADPNFPPTDLLLAALSFAIQDPKSGRSLLERAGAQHRQNASVYAAFSRLAINEGRLVDADALLGKMSNILDTAQIPQAVKDFHQLQYLDGMSDVAMRQNRYSDARTYLTKQRELAPDNPKVLMVSAELEFKEKDLQKSMEYLTMLRAKIPQTRTPETIIASWFQRIGNQEDAKKWILSAGEKYANSQQVQLEVASWAVNEEDFPTASAAIKKAELQGEVPLSKGLKGKIAFANGSYAIAESHYQKLTELQPDNFDSANMYALCLIESQDPAKHQKALEIANRNFRALPDNVVSQAALGYIQLKLGELEPAKSALARALQANNSSPEIRFFGASMLRALKQPVNAKTVLELALNHKGLFLYRSAARDLLTEVEKEIAAAPKKE